MRDIGNEASIDNIASRANQNRYSGRSAFGGKGSRISPHYDYLNRHCGQFGRK